MDTPQSTLVSDLPADQQQELQAQLADPGHPTAPVQTPEGDDVAHTLTPEQWAELSIQTKGEADPIKWAADHPKAPPDLLQKAADAHAMLVSRGFNWRDIDLGKSLKGIGEIVKGTGQYAAKALQVGLVNPIGGLVTPKLRGGAQAEFEKQRTADSAALVSATESAQFGLGDILRKGAAKVSRWAGKAYQKLAVDPSLMPSFMKDPLDQTPIERLNSMWNEAGIIQQKENISRGHGAVADTVLGNAIADMEAAGGKIDPQAVESMAAGDPITFVAFGQGFKVGAMVATGAGKSVFKTLATFTDKIPAVEAAAALRVAQQTMAKAGATVKTAESTSVAAGAEATRTADVAATNLGAEQGAARATAAEAFPSEIAGEPGFVKGLINLEGSPTLSADLNAAATAANAARRAEMAIIPAKAELETAIKNLAQAEKTAATTPGIDLVQKAGKIGNRLVEVKNKVGEAAAGTVERAADIGLGFVPGAVGVAARTAEAVGKTISGILPPIATPHYVRVLTGKMGALAEGSFDISGKLMKGEAKNFSPLVGVASSAAQAIPTTAAEMGKGFVVDAALAAVTSETPADTANMPVFMTAFGAARGLGISAAHGVQRQLIDPRNTGTSTRSANTPYNRFSALDAANKFAVDQAKDPDVVTRLAAIRDFNKDTGAQMYLVPEEAMVKKILQRYLPGLDETRYDEMANQSAVYLTIKDDAGNLQKVGIFRELDAAPHESGHAAQDVLGERAMSGIDNLVYDEYAHIWDAVGNNYARRFFNPQHMAEAASRGEGWQDAVLDLSLGTANWRGKLTPEQINGMADHYLAREISAEAFDAIFKHTGPDLLQNNSLPGKLARILGKTLVGMGIEPFQNFRTKGQGVPLTFNAAENLRNQFQMGMETAKVEAARPDIAGIPPYGGKKVGKAPLTHLSPQGAGPEPLPSSASTPKTAADDARGYLPDVSDQPIVRGGRSQQQILSDIADAIEKGTGLSLDYRSAPGEPAGAITSNRVARRNIIELFRKAPPEARALFEKQFLPEQVVRITGGKLQVMGWSPEVFAANAQKLAQALADAKSTRLSPYEIDKKTGTFTERGWRELFVDATNFSRNQQRGLTGAGGPLVVPAGVVEKGFFPPEATGEPGHPLDQARADMLSALFSIPIPKTPRIGKVFPRNLVGQEVSAATQPGRVSVPVEPRAPFEGIRAKDLGIEGRTINEVNPFRAELEKQGIKPDFIEALQRLNLDNIADVSPAPKTATELRGKEFTLQAGFQPKKDEPRAVKSAAVRVTNSKTNEQQMFTGFMHADAYQKAYEAGALPDGISDMRTDWGFITNNGEFLDNEAALQRAQELKQISARDVKEMVQNQNMSEGSLESVTFDAMRRFQPKDVNEISDLAPEDFIKKIRAAGTGLTNQAYDLAKNLTPADLPVVEAAEKKAKSELDAAVKIRKEGMAADPNAKFEDFWAAESGAQNKKQFFNETARAIRANEEAKGVTDPAKLHEIEQRLGIGHLLTPQQKIDFMPKFQSKTEAGKTLEDKGFFFERQGSPGYRSLIVKDPNGEVVGSILSTQSSPDTATVAGVDVTVPFRRQGIAESLYRELLTDLQSDGVKNVAGYVISPAPIQLRNKILGPQATAYFSEGEAIPMKEALAKTEAIQSVKPGEPYDHLSGPYVLSQLDAEAAFQPGIKGYIGNLSPDDNVTGKWTDLAKTTHEQLGHDIDDPNNGDNWRYNPQTKTVYWWNDTPSNSAKEHVAAWLERKGQEVKHHTALNPSNSTSRKYDEAHGTQFSPKSEAQFSPKIIDLEHRSSAGGLTEVDPSFFGKGKATPTDLRGGNKSFFYVKGSDLGQDEPIFGKDLQLHNYKGSIPERELYDLRKGQPDPLKWRQTINREEADTNVKEAGYSGIVLDTADGRQVVALFKKIPVTQFQTAKRGEQEMLPGISAKRAPLSTIERASMTRQEIRDHYPEAVVPRANNESIPSDILGSPLYKEAGGSEDTAVDAFANRLVSFAKEYQDKPLFHAGASWYSDFVPRLKKEFGKDAPLMAELLSATSPQTNVETNFGYAHDALQSLKAGRFDKIISKFNEGMTKMEDGSWESWLKRNASPGANTPAAFLAAWINKFDLKPRQSNGKLYGQHSLAVIKVLTGRWVKENTGPKTANFVQNLTGDSKEATIDLWADRTMRWAGYEGHVPRWRILAENKAAVSDADFTFSQKVFNAAAKKMNMEPSALQGALWFAEKQRWADNGWGYLNLGTFQAEMDKLPFLKTGFKQRVEQQTQIEKGKNYQQLALDIRARFK